MRFAASLPADAVGPRAAPECWASGVATIDAALGGGFALGRVHEFYAATVDDAGAATGFAIAVALGMVGDTGSVLALRSRRAVAGAGVLQGAGWADLGGAPEKALFAVAAEGAALLRAAVDAMRARALAGVIIETWGAMPVLDLTAHRRLALTAEKSGVPLLLVRVDTAPAPSAAQTRWQVAAAPSQPMPGQAPGLPAFAINLLRQRGGPADLGWTLEWDRDQRLFRDRAAAPHVGAVVPAAPRRTLAISAGAASGERIAA